MVRQPDDAHTRTWLSVQRGNSEATTDTWRVNVEGCLAQMAQVHSPHAHSPHAQVGEKHAETAGAERKAVTNTLSVWHVSRHVTLTQSDLLVSRAKSDSRQQIEWMVSTDHDTSNGHQVERLERCKLVNPPYDLWLEMKMAEAVPKLLARFFLQRTVTVKCLGLKESKRCGNHLPVWDGLIDGHTSCT